MPLKTSLEQHYTPEQLGKRWHCSANTVRRMAGEFGGVLVIDRPETMHKRAYRSIGIPESTANAIYAKFFMPLAA
jgi:transcriptional regulator of acetoin/glycerol metabolism